MKIKKHCLFIFFKCSFIKRVGYVIFELDKVNISNFVKFQFQRMTLKIERVFKLDGVGPVDNRPSSE